MSGFPEPGSESHGLVSSREKTRCFYDFGIAASFPILCNGLRFSIGAFIPRIGLGDCIVPY